MSWLDDEAESNKQKEAIERQSAEVISHSNYWAEILRVLEGEVRNINAHEYWKTKLAEFPLRFEQRYDGDGYTVSKSGFPAVQVRIQNKGSYLMLTRDFHENPLSRDFRDEKLQRGTTGDRVVFLTKDEQALMVPGDVVQYILKAIIESLKITKSTP